jgi:hypothetical protein
LILLSFYNFRNNFISVISFNIMNYMLNLFFSYIIIRKILSKSWSVSYRKSSFRSYNRSSVKYILFLNFLCPSYWYSGKTSSRISITIVLSRFRRFSISDGSTYYYICSILSGNSSIRLGDKLACSCSKSLYESSEISEIYWRYGLIAIDRNTINRSRGSWI